MKLFQIVVSMLATSSLAAAESMRIEDGRRLKCRSAPNSNGLVLRSYGDRDVMDITCKTYGSAVGSTRIWHRTRDGCYVTDKYLAVSNGTEPQCADKDSPEPCREIGSDGLALIEKYEGFISRPRPDITGLPTIGYGHECESLDCVEVPVAFPFSRAQAHELLRMDVRNITACLAQAVDHSVQLNANQWAALTSWAANVGCPMASQSQLVARLNRGEEPNSVAALELPRWRIYHGKRQPELVSRRADEVELFRTPTTSMAFPHCVISSQN
ncbi:hypothetical protein IWW36_003589 [Coemansia brasiliensis]|uniref:Lysozyme n=1 Tax=Coemansia brasiliensis TaxID=2650707 RepID=A0A9W8IDS9_9FUNG|nr:hypothetical protein IWW36_003589 [Coemansia brasiliensis]